MRVSARAGEAAAASSAPLVRSARPAGPLVRLAGSVAAGAFGSAGDGVRATWSRRWSGSGCRSRYPAVRPRSAIVVYDAGRVASKKIGLRPRGPSRRGRRRLPLPPLPALARPPPLCPGMRGRDCRLPSHCGRLVGTGDTTIGGGNGDARSRHERRPDERRGAVSRLLPGGILIRAAPGARSRSAAPAETRDAVWCGRRRRVLRWSERHLGAHHHGAVCW